MIFDLFSGCTVDSVKKIKYLMLILEKQKIMHKFPQT